MGTVVARTKSNNKLQKIQCKVDDNIFDMNEENYSGAVAYDGSLLHHEEWLKYTFKEEHHLFKPINAATLSSVDNNNVFDILMFAYYDAGIFYFQKVRKSNKVLRKHFSFALDKVEVEEPSKIISINRLPDGIFDVATKTVYFKNVSDVSFLFPELNREYKTATDTDVDKFLDLSDIKTSQDFDKKKLTIIDRKRITSIVEEIQQLDEQKKDELRNYIRKKVDNKITYNEENNVFEVNNEKELRILAYGFQHRIYSTPFDAEVQIATERTGISRILEIS